MAVRWTGGYAVALGQTGAAAQSPPEAEVAKGKRSGGGGIGSAGGVDSACGSECGGGGISRSDGGDVGGAEPLPQSFPQP